MKHDALRLMVVGAHPDDCEYHAGGLAALCAKAGWKVRFVAVTSGNAGHHEMGPRALAERRMKEARRAAAGIGASYVNLMEPDGRLYVTDRTTGKVVRAIRSFAPDVLVSHRTSDYHRDHRTTGQLVQDASFLLQVPHVYSETPALERVPVILYACDFFSEGPAFRGHVFFDIGPVRSRYIEMLMAHESQFFEWLPWLGGRREVGRKNPLRDRGAVAAGLGKLSRRVADRFQRDLRKKYRRQVEMAEVFQISEYGARLSAGEINKLLPF